MKERLRKELFLMTARSFYESLWYLLTYVLTYVLTYAVLQRANSLDFQKIEKKLEH